ncbi:MAG TPA: YifB family Mg chelatase-like AAA ATPase [Acidobacteriota bacterium]|nr:YifB family Mg chelatase-like AAA ATPase [Acidobacteriota bacterium]
MFAKVTAASILGIEAVPVDVEVDVASKGMVRYTVVGLPDAAIKESEERVKAAIKNSGMALPVAPVTVNLAPADLKKEGSAFDLPIAVGILAASGVIPQQSLEDYLIVGELSLDGKLRPVKGALSMASLAARKKIKGVLVPADNAPEASVVDGIKVYPLRNMPEAIEFLCGNLQIEPHKVDREEIFERGSSYEVDMSEVRGQAHAKRALEVAAAGGHNLIMVGVPGSGKTMLSRRLPTILPPMTFEEAIETTTIHSVAGAFNSRLGLTAVRPFRSPHHTISNAGLVGGGVVPKPGEVSMAHNGVLFLDELPEFPRNVLDVLRQPLEDGFVTISRVHSTIAYPARFMLVAAMNPCPCGYHGDPERECRCTPQMIIRYRSKISGPLMDRIDIHIAVPAVKYREISSETGGEKSDSVRDRVIKAREVQLERLKPHGLYCNARLSQKLIKSYCVRDDDAESLLESAFRRLGLSARAYTRILKVARTIADLEASEVIRPVHISEAIQYRMLDREI